MTRPHRPSLWLHRFAVLTAAATFFLVIAGGLVTSTGSGLAVPDWPLSYGMLFPPMVGGIFYEHGHRMIAGVVGLMTMALAVWLWAGEPRRWVRRLGLAAALAVLAQAGLGGITVLFLLPTPVSVGHAGLAMAFFSLATAIALVTGAGWRAPLEAAERRTLAGALPLPRLALVTTVAVYLQVLLGATVRHTGAGLACPDFPLCNGEIVPTVGSLGVALQLGHRAGAVIVTGLVLWLAGRVLRRHGDEPGLRAPAIVAVALLATQVGLGAWTVWSGLAVGPTTAHVAAGALLLATLVVLTLQAYRRFRCGAAVGSPAVARREALA